MTPLIITKNTWIEEFTIVSTQNFLSMVCHQSFFKCMPSRKKQSGSTGITIISWTTITQTMWTSQIHNGFKIEFSMSGRPCRNNIMLQMALCTTHEKPIHKPHGTKKSDILHLEYSIVCMQFKITNKRDSPTTIR